MEEDSRKKTSTVSLNRAQSMSIDLALANQVFDTFCNASTLKSILKSYRSLCEILRIKPGQFPHFYPRIKAKLRSWKAQALWTKFDKRASHKVYKGGKACANQRVLVIGAGPCGLRTAIEAQLLGAKVVVLEKRDRFSRNNVLHLWPYNIVDLRGLGAKKFYGKFCAGAIDHISIRQLQCILLKVSLLLGVEVFENVGFEDLIEPTGDSESGWKARVTPADHPLSHYELDVLIGADGKRNTLHGFKRKEFRGKLAIAITANFINRHTEAESRVEEISGVAFIFNQKFFNDMNEAKGISLENIVYYKDETHYFVMTAKKQSLINKGVIIENEADTAKLLSQENINQEALFDYAREAADFATNYKLPHLEFAVNHYGKPDVAMFDFTSMFQAENSCRVVERHGHKLLIGLVGDSLLEPFWPTGTGCARGFFGGLDTCWLMRGLAIGKQTLLEALAERESIYRVLNQTTPENTCKNYASYTVDPQTRYPTLNRQLVLPFQVTHLVDTDNPSLVEEELQNSNNSISKQSDSAKKTKRRRESHVSPDTLLTWFQTQLESYDCIQISDMTFSFQNGLALCAIIHRYRPELIEFLALDPALWIENTQLAFDILENDLGISPVMTGKELATTKSPDKLTLISYLSQIYELFRKDIPVIKQPKMDVSDDDLLDSQYRHNHPKPNKSGMRRKYHDSEKQMTIGQLVASDAAGKKKKRRSKENELQPDDEEGMLNKENIEETQKLNRSAQKKRLQKLMERAEATNDVRKKREDQERKSIKKEERYRIIEEQFSGSSSRRRQMINESISKYRENKKPKDLKRAIGKLDKDDWNIKNIEEKMVVPVKTEGVHKDKVPKWSKAAFQDKFNIMKGKLERSDAKKGDKENSDDSKFAEIDSSLDKLQTKLKEGSALEIGERGSNKVSALAGELQAKDDADTSPSIPKSTPEIRKESNSNLVNLGRATGGSECCHFCEKRVYVVERMSAGGKFFHRSCFRCDYCNILLRLGSYVFHREGPFGGKFFCLPHSTENALEKYRYRKKADELRDAENRKAELIMNTNSDWHRKESDGRRNPLEYIDSLPTRHKDRLLRHDRRETTPERAEFEASIESEEDAPSIMDEDEWTDRNFGNSLLKETGAKKIVKDSKNNKTNNGLKNDVDASDDSVSDLDTDTDDDDDGDLDLDEGSESRPLTANEARQLRDEWVKKYDKKEDSKPNTENDGYSSSSCSSSVSSNEDDEDEEDSSDYDGEYESSSNSESCESDIEPGSDHPPRPSLPAEQRPSKERRNRQVRSRHRESESTDTSTGVGSEDLSSADDDSEDEFSSRTATECEFTDSEGRPNPFHKDLDEGRMLGPESPDAPMRIYQQHRMAKRENGGQASSDQSNESAQPSNALTYSANLQYKTPNLSDRLKLEQQKTTNPMSDFSTRKALNLKKNWVSEKSTDLTTKKKVDSAEVDLRLKSLMDRLSSQQALLKPADKPSNQMQHFLDSTQHKPHISFGRISTNGPASVKSPIISSPPETASTFTYQNKNSPSSLYTVPSMYRSLSTESRSTTNDAAKLSEPEINKNEKHIKNELAPNPVKTSASIPDLHLKIDKLEDKVFEKEIVIHETTSEIIDVDADQEQGPDSIDFGKLAVPESSLNDSGGSSAKDDDFQSCDENNKVEDISEAVNDRYLESEEANNCSALTTGDSDFKTPGSLDSSALRSNDEIINITEESNQLSPDMIQANPLATSSPLDFKDFELIDENGDDSIKEDIIVVEEEEVKKVVEEKPWVKILGDDDMMRVYSVDDPMERRARYVSCNEKEKSLISNLILSRVSNTPRSSSGVRRPRRMLPPTYSPPAPPPDSSGEEAKKKLSTAAAAAPKLVMKNEVTPKTATASNTNVNSKISTTSAPPVRNATISPPAILKVNDTPPLKSPPVCLPATPLTDPEKFGIPQSKDERPSRPIGRYDSPLKRSVTVEPSSSPNLGLVSPSDSNTSNDVECLDGIISTDESMSKSFNSENSNKLNNSSGSAKDKKTFMKTISGMFSRSSSVSALNRQPQPSQMSTSDSLKSQVPNIKSANNIHQNNNNANNTAINKASNKELKAQNNFRFPKLNFARSTSVSRSDKATPRGVAPRADISEIGSLSSLSMTTPKKEMSLSLTKSVETLSMKASHPSTPPVPLTRKITIASDSCIDFGADSLSENEENQSPDTSWNSSTKSEKRLQQEQELKSSNKHHQVPPEILEKIIKRGGGKTAKRAARAAQLKRVRKAQEIQRQLEEIDEEHKDLESKGIITEMSLRGENNAGSGKGNRTPSVNSESELMQTWFQLLSEKNRLVRCEQELLVQAKELELEDRSGRLEAELREHLMLDSRSPESVVREGEVLKELLDISEQREKLQSMLERDKERYQKEDKDIEAQMLAKGLKLAVVPVRKLVQ